jgi:hypothetical protein
LYTNSDGFWTSVVRSESAILVLQLYLGSEVTGHKGKDQMENRICMKETCYCKLQVHGMAESPRCRNEFRDHLECKSCTKIGDIITPAIKSPHTRTPEPPKQSSHQQRQDPRSISFILDGTFTPMRQPPKREILRAMASSLFPRESPSFREQQQAPHVKVLQEASTHPVRVREPSHQPTSTIAGTRLVPSSAVVAFVSSKHGSLLECC